MEKSIIKILGITKEFKESNTKPFVVIKNINLEILEGEIFIILGPSGSGKSTLLKIISGLENEYEGRVNFSPGVNRSDISFVFQQFALLPWLTVKDNVSIGLLARGKEKEIINKKVEKELKTLGLEKFANSFPKELSGGMRQRVGLARALITEPKIIFMDEPFSEVDSFTAQELRDDLLNIWQERKMTIVMVTHLISEAIELGGRIAVFTPRPGKIEIIVNNNLPRPRDKRSASFYELEDKLYKIIKP